MVTIKSLEAMIAGCLKALMEGGFGPRRAILFGSYAKGCPHEWSDIDLAVWADKFEGAYVLDYPKIARFMRLYVEIELHPFHTGETTDDNPFIEEIESTGKDVSFLMQPDTSLNHSTQFYNAFL